MFKVWVRDYADPVLMEMEQVTLMFLVCQTAASILQACAEYPATDDLIDGPSGSGIGRWLTASQNWASHGFTNALQSQVQFLYALVEAHVKAGGKTHFLGDPSVKKLVADALTTYQGWKTMVCRDGQARNGGHWGTATGFFKADWTDLNQKLLEDIKQEAA